MTVPRQALSADPPGPRPLVAAAPPSDEALMMVAKRGDASAFATLARRYAGRLLAHCRSLTRNAHIAEEAAQDTWLGLWSNRAGYEPTSRFVVLLFTAARNRCRNVRRGKNRESAALGAPLAGEIDLLASASPSSLDEVIARQRREHVAARVSGLSETLREALVLRVANDLSYADIAAILEIPEATARSRVHLAIQHLRELMQKEIA
jgi:RNA polymerase sigma-70 factor (ECF subfamily)